MNCVWGEKSDTSIEISSILNLCTFLNCIRTNTSVHFNVKQRKLSPQVANLNTAFQNNFTKPIYTTSNHPHLMNSTELDVKLVTQYLCSRPTRHRNSRLSDLQKNRVLSNADLDSSPPFGFFSLVWPTILSLIYISFQFKHQMLRKRNQFTDHHISCESISSTADIIKTNCQDFTKY